MLLHGKVLEIFNKLLAEISCLDRAILVLGLSRVVDRLSSAEINNSLLLEGLLDNISTHASVKFLLHRLAVI